MNMIVKRVALSAVAGGLSLSALAAAPASASDHHGDDSDDPSVSVKVWDRKVKVTYSCDTEEDDHGHHWGKKGGDDDDEDEYGVLKVKFRDATWKKSVKCDGDDHDVYFKVGGKKGGEFKAIIKDPDGDKAKDSAWIKKKHHHHDHH